MSIQRAILTLALLLFVHSAGAEGSVYQDPGDLQGRWLSLATRHGLVVNIPAWPRAELVHRLAHLGANLRTRKIDLANHAEQKKFNAGDAIITLVAPGGLIYAVFRQQEYQRAASAAQQAATQLDRLQQDLVAFEIAPAASLVAAAH